MKNFCYLLFISLIINIYTSALAKTFYIGDKVNNYFNYNKDIKIKLSPGNWSVIRTAMRGVPKQKIVGIGRVENNEIMELVEVYEGLLAGYYVSYVEPVLMEIVFKDEHDGCYERPEYYLLELYQKGSTFNCMIISHMDVTKELNYPDSPDGKAAASAYNFWIKQNSLTYPKIMLASYHTYFSRIAGAKWYEVRHSINPKLLNAPNSKFFSEETSEYHKHNISQYPEHKKIMTSWVSISSKFHKDFENMSKTKNKHKLSLDKYITNTKLETNSDKPILDQLNQLNELYKSGVLTKDEFIKAKKKLLD